MAKTCSNPSSWNVVMNEKKNPLQNNNLQPAHMIMQILSWMWIVIFSVSFGSYLVFGVTSVGHMLVITGLFITLIFFRNAEARRKQPQVKRRVSLDDRHEIFWG